MNTEDVQNRKHERIRAVIDDVGISDAAFARSLDNFSRANLSQILKGNRSVPDKLLHSIERVYGIRYSWLLTGEGEMREEQITKSTEYTSGVPYYNVDFTLGFDILLNDQTTQPDYYVNFPPYNKCTCWINARGDSMSPTISAGDMVALQRIEDFRFLISGEIYAIVTRNGLRTIKRVNDLGDSLRLIPDNKDYEEQVISKSDILGVFYVKGNVKAF